MMENLDTFGLPRDHTVGKRLRIILGTIYYKTRGCGWTFHESSQKRGGLVRLLLRSEFAFPRAAILYWGDLYPQKYMFEL